MARRFDIAKDSAEVMEYNEIAQARSLSVINLVIGIWLIIAPYILNYGQNVAYWSEMVTGAFIVIMSLARLFMPHMSTPSWFNGIAGIWLIISPFIFGYNYAAAYWNSIIFGIIVAVLSYSNVGSIHHAHPAR